MKRLPIILLVCACASLTWGADPKPVIPVGSPGPGGGFTCVYWYVKEIYSGVEFLKGFAMCFGGPATEEILREAAPAAMWTIGGLLGCVEPSDPSTCLSEKLLARGQLVQAAGASVAFPELGDAVTDSTLATCVCGSSSNGKKTIQNPTVNKGGCYDAMICTIKGLAGASAVK